MTDTDGPPPAGMTARQSETNLEPLRATVQGVGEVLDVNDPVGTFLKGRTPSENDGKNIASYPVPSGSGYGDHPNHLARGVASEAVETGSVPDGADIAAENRSLWYNHIRPDGEVSPVGFTLLCSLTSGAQGEAGLVMAIPYLGEVSEDMDNAGLDFHDGLCNGHSQGKSVMMLRAGNITSPGAYTVANPEDGHYVLQKEGKQDVPVIGIARDGRGNLFADSHYGAAIGGAWESVAEATDFTYQYLPNWRVYDEAGVPRGTWDSNDRGDPSFKEDFWRYALEEV